MKFSFELINESFKTYSASFYQNGLNAPEATELINELGGSIAWAFDSDGIFIGTLAGAFKEGKTEQVSGILNIPDGACFTLQRIDDNTVSLRTGYLANLQYGNGILNNFIITFKVYN